MLKIQDFIDFVVENKLAECEFDAPGTDIWIKVKINDRHILDYVFDSDKGDHSIMHWDLNEPGKDAKLLGSVSGEKALKLRGIEP